MAYTIDVSNDYTFFDNPESVTIALKRSAGTTTLTTRTVFRRQLSRDDVQAGDAHLRSDVMVFHVPETELFEVSQYDMREGDEITDAAIVGWIVKSAQHQSRATRWRCICRKARS